MRIERYKYTSPPSPVEAFRRVSSKISRKTTNVRDDDSNHRLLDQSSRDQSDDQHEDYILPFTSGKFVRKSTPLNDLVSLKSPGSVKKALMNKINTAVEHNSYFGYNESRDDESNVGLLSHDGQYETRCESRWSDFGNDEEESTASTAPSAHAQTSEASTKPLLPDLVDLGGFSSSESTESGKENIYEMIAASLHNEEQSDDVPVSNTESLAGSHGSEEDEKVQILQEEATKGEEIKERTVEEDVTYSQLDQVNEMHDSIQLEGSSSTVDFDEDLSLTEHPVSIVEDQASLEGGTEGKSMVSTATGITSYASYTRHVTAPIVVSSSEHGDVILLSPKGYEDIPVASTSPVPSLESEDESQYFGDRIQTSVITSSVLSQILTNRLEQIKDNDGGNVKVDPSNDGQRDDDEKENENDEFVISDDWSENESVGNSSDPFGECIVNERFLEQDNEAAEEHNSVANDNDSSGDESDATPESHISDLERNELITQSSSSVDLASFNQIWESSSKLSGESGSDSEELDESKRSGEKKNYNDAWAISDSESSGDDDKSNSSRKDDNDGFDNLNKYWVREWNDLTIDDNTDGAEPVENNQHTLTGENIKEIEPRDKYATVDEEEEDSDDFYGCGIEGSGDYSYDSFGLETISEEGEFDEEEALMPLSHDDIDKEDNIVVEEENRMVEESAATDNAVKECDTADGSVSREAIVVETVREFSSDGDDNSDVEEEAMELKEATLPAVKEEHNEDFCELKISETTEKPVRQIKNIASAKAIIPFKKRANIKHSIRESKKSSFPRIKKAGSADTTFDNLSNFFDDVACVNASQDSLDTGSSSNHTEVLLEDDELKKRSYMKRTSIKRHVFTKLIAPVSALVSRRRSSDLQDFVSPTNGLQEVFKRRCDQGGEIDDTHLESDDDYQAQELAQMLSTAMMAREQEKNNKATAFAKQLAEIRETFAMEQELAEIEGGHGCELNYHDYTASVENCSISDDDSQIEILNEEVVASAALTPSNKVESNDLHDLWSKIDEYQATDKSLNETQLAMLVNVFNSQVEECQTVEAVKDEETHSPSSKQDASIDERSDVNDVVETSAEVDKESKCEVEPFETNIDLEQGNTFESADDFEAQIQLCSIPSAMSINSFASIISADKSTDSLGDISKSGSDTSKGSLVSKLYRDNTDLAETLAATQYELEKALKELEKTKMERDELIATVVDSKPVPVPKSSFDDYFERDESIRGNNNSWDEEDIVTCESGIGEI